MGDAHDRRVTCRGFDRGRFPRYQQNADALQNRFAGVSSEDLQAATCKRRGRRIVFERPIDRRVAPRRMRRQRGLALQQQCGSVSRKFCQRRNPCDATANHDRIEMLSQRNAA